MNARGAQVVNAHGVLIQTALKLPPTIIVTQMAQDTFQPIVGEIEPLDVLPGHRLQGEQPVGYPGLNMHEAVIAPGYNGAEPDGADPAHTSCRERENGCQSTSAAPSAAFIRATAECRRRAP